MNTQTTFDGVARLTHWGVIRAHGEDAATFLHGQLSQDVQTLDAKHARLGAYCTAKGRMLASMLILRPAPDEIWLLCSTDVLPATLKRLSMFVLRSKVKLSDASTEIALLGYAGPTALTIGAETASPWDVMQPSDGHVVHLPDALGPEGQPIERRLWIGQAAAGQARMQAGPPLPLDHWRWLEVASGIATITQPVVEQFVPQMVNFELVGGVNFKKGCYPGQEIVARSQYLGKLKRRTVRVDAQTVLQPGQEVYASGDPGQPAGMIVNAAPHPAGGYSALVEIKLAALDGSASLHLGAADGPVLQLGTLPYALPADDPALSR